ncbi:TolQ1 [Desulfamplus magnetovallimortis]|uniref:TolQ1 n=1 Tax=Desulfamplus magnetovallimortis TaxID=1246637 RepID=A0A1W1HKE4_9BACT|nr:protein TolQ [Desulfamplus magnetovallimortis]SLM32939.1 TolQ1 [Desulfamplus magnetovallimortis]
MNPETTDLFHMLMNAGPVVKAVLLLLLFFSITSWAIVFIKYRYIRRAYRDSVDFTDIFWQCRNLADAFAKAKILRTSPVARVFITGYMEIKKYEQTSTGASDTRGKTDGMMMPSYNIMSSVQRALRRSINVEIRRLSQLVPFLATAGNTAPFIGLFGTVWGIMNTFHGIGMSKSASLAVVAPGISEALVATAAGLAVAIPSVMAYNYFTDRIRVLDSELQSFVADLLNIIERDLQKNNINSSSVTASTSDAGTASSSIRGNSSGRIIRKTPLTGDSNINDKTLSQRVRT